MTTKQMRDVPRTADVWLVIRKAAHWIELHGIRSVASTGLGLTDFAVLKSLLYRGPMPVNVIGAKVLLTSGSITSAVDRLEAQGLVERRDHPTDRRASLVHLTETGAASIKPASGAHASTMADVVAVLSESEQQELVWLMKKIGKHAMGTYRPSEVIPLNQARRTGKSGPTPASAKTRAQGGK